MDKSEHPSLPYPRSLLDRLVHPYLLFAKDDVAALRAKMGKPAFAKTYAVLRRQAENDLTYPTVGMPRPRSGGGQPPDGPRGFRAIVCRMAFMHVLTGTREYLDRCMEEIEAVTQTQWVEPKHPQDNPVNAIWYGFLGLGERAEALGLAYDWLHASLSQRQRARILEIAREDIFEAHWMAAQRRGEWGTREYMNWNPVINGGVGVLALATLADLPEAHRSLELTRWLIPRFAKRIGRDGDWDEGVMYTHYAMSCGATFFLAMRNTLGTDDGLGERLKNLGYFTQMLRWHDREGRIRQFRFRDSSPFGSRLLPHLLALFPENRDYLRLFDAEAGPGELTGPEKCSTKFHDYSFWTHTELIFRPDVPPDTTPVCLPRAKLFRDGGIFCFRGEKLHFCALGIDTGANHGQMDMGSFELVYDKEHLITDLNYGDRDSLDHSCLTVNGARQVFRLAGRMHGLREQEDGQLTSVTLELPALYGPVLRRCRRHYLVLREAAVAIVDEVEAIEPVAIEARFTALHPIEASGACEACESPCAQVRGNLYGLRIVSHPAAGPVRFTVRELTSRRSADESYRQAISALGAPVRTVTWLHVLTPFPIGGDGVGMAVKIEFPRKDDPLCFAIAYGNGRRDVVSADREADGTLAWRLTAEAE